jgi:hypothetical protein
MYIYIHSIYKFIVSRSYWLLAFLWHLPILGWCGFSQCQFGLAQSCWKTAFGVSHGEADEDVGNAEIQDQICWIWTSPKESKDTIPDSAKSKLSPKCFPGKHHPHHPVRPLTQWISFHCQWISTIRNVFDHFRCWQIAGGSMCTVVTCGIELFVACLLYIFGCCSLMFFI